MAAPYINIQGRKKAGLSPTSYKKLFKDYHREARSFINHL